MPRLIQSELPYDTTTARPRPGAIRTVRLGSRVLAYRLVRSRRRTIAIHIDRGDVQARAPGSVPVSAVEAFLREKEHWITKRLGDPAREPRPFRWSDGEALPVLGRAVRLTASVEASTVRLTGEHLLLPAAATMHWRRLAMEWLCALALEMFHERVGHYATTLGIPPPSIGLSNARTRWGSCCKRRGEHGRILLNWRLAHLPQHLADYVVAHELAHLKELNHSPRFWAVVERVYPAYRSARRELRRIGATLPEL